MAHAQRQRAGKPDLSRSSPALSSAHPFTNVRLSAAYWSSTSYTARTPNAMAIRISDRRWINGIDANRHHIRQQQADLGQCAVGSQVGRAGKGATALDWRLQRSRRGSYAPADDASMQMGAALPGPRFVDKGDGTVADTATGLI